MQEERDDEHAAEIEPAAEPAEPADTDPGPVIRATLAALDRAARHNAAAAAEIEQAERIAERLVRRG
jgi:hypothetical protein